MKRADGEEGQFLGETEPYDAVVLDLGLPKVDGVSVLKAWRGADRRFSGADPYGARPLGRKRWRALTPAPTTISPTVPYRGIAGPMRALIAAPPGTPRRRSSAAISASIPAPRRATNQWRAGAPDSHEYKVLEF